MVWDWKQVKEDEVLPEDALGTAENFVVANKIHYLIINKA